MNELQDLYDQFPIGSTVTVNSDSYSSLHPFTGTVVDYEYDLIVIEDSTGYRWLCQENEITNDDNDRYIH